MKQLDIFIISVIIIGSLQTTYAQTDETDMMLEVSDEEKIILFASFAIAVIAIFLFLARDIILRKKTSYDNEEFESKKENKNKFRELAKKTHPDKTKEDSEEAMAKLNKAYEILSDKERREKYDRYLKVS